MCLNHFVRVRLLPAHKRTALAGQRCPNKSIKAHDGTPHNLDQSPRSQRTNMASAFGAKPLPKHLKTATAHDEWDDVEVPAFVTPSFYKPPPPPLPKEPVKKAPTKSQRAMAKARAANMGIAYGKPRKKVKKAPTPLASPPRTVNTPVKSVTMEASSPA